ncbi:MAG: hypothetical protein O3A00_02620 [Planctomycetota bacterium]|nr:hypothetical protein [Planctomycetota bacterium]
MTDLSANLQASEPVRRSLAAQLRLVALPATIAMVWWLALGNLAATTANSMTVNLRQLRHADLVLRVRVDDVSEGNVSILAVWKPNVRWETLATATAISISNLAATNAVDGGEFFVPVTRGKNDAYAVTTFELRTTEDDKVRSPPYVYPVDADSTSRLTAALEKLDAVLAPN